MPIGPFGEIIGTTGTLECLGEGATNYKSKVVAPRNPKLVKEKDTLFKMKPSQFLFQMSMNTEQKLANMHTMKVPRKVELLDMGDTTHQKISSVSIDEPMFQPFPSEMFFQNFEPFETYEIPLILRNNDKVPRLVKVTQAESPYFKIISPHNVGHKVGPGLPTTFKLQFTPEEKKDYIHELVCITEREKFVVPVKAIGARAILDFPDNVNFGVNPVKYSSTKTLLVRNIGNKEAKFELSTEVPYKVNPENGVLPVGESMQVTIEFKPMHSGDHQHDLVLHYATGEDLYINLYGAAQDVNVRLDKNSLRIGNTFLSMANQRIVTISNRSDVIAHYRWTQFATEAEENQQRLGFYDGLAKDEDVEKDRFLEECVGDPSLRDKLALLSRSFQNRKRLVDGDRLVFNDDVLKIEPVEGDIWPNSSAEVTVIFKPAEAKVYERIAFCDVTGRDSRLPLRVRGEGAGPKIQFSFDELDMGNIFINSTHTYEVVLANKGDIDAIFTLVPNRSVFGSKFEFNPAEGIVMPEGHQAVQVTFNSPVLGDFQEDFFFQIDGSPQQLKLTFTGSVIGPTFHFDVPKLKFGYISYGFVTTQTCSLMNTSLIPMSFTLRVPGDGFSESICSTSEYDSTVSEAGSNLPPKEFDIVPSSGVLPPSSETKIKVSICSNSIKKYDLSLVVDVEGVGDEVVSLPITARCIVPQITVLSLLLDYGRCFLRHPYEHHVKLQNDTDLPAKYELVPQQIDQFTPIVYTSPQPKGIIEPRSICDIPLVITPQGLEELESVAYFAIFGSQDPPLPVTLSCIGEGPVVHVMPLDMDWGQIPVLTDTSKIVRLTNESLIAAKFTAHMVRPNSVWRVEPSSGEIPAEGMLELTVTAHLDDCCRFKDKLLISFLDSQTRTVPVTGYGYGTTVTANPPMSPTLNLGPHFSKGPCKRTFTLTNRGRRHQSLVWSTEGFPLTKPKKAGLVPINPKDMKFRDMPPEPEPPRPIFKLTPARMELNPGDSVDVELEGFVDSPQIVKERMLCHAIIGRAGGKELIMKVAISCEFITPLLEFSNQNMFFKINKRPGDTLELQTQELTLTNISSLPLTLLLRLDHPFQMLFNNQEMSETEIFLGIGESYCLCIQFDPAYREDSHSRTIDQMLTVAYKEHPHVDEIAIRGEVYFPNLEFEKTEVDFGCILNDTEVTRYLNISNNSPMDVKYKWSFLIGNEPVTVFHKRVPERESPIEVEDIEGEGQMEPEEMEVELHVHRAESPREEENIDNKDIEGDKEELIGEEGRPAEDGEEKKDEEKPAHAEGEEALPQEVDVVQVEVPIMDKIVDHMSLGESRPDTQLGTPRTPAVINRTLAALLEQDQQDPSLGVEEVFDILPLYGTLKPGDTEQITLTFYGHSDIGSHAKAICEVEGGPTYEVTLKGEASLVEHRFDCLDIDYGKQMFDQVATSEIVLYNTGRVGFQFTALGMDPGMASKPKPGIPVMIPHTGYIEAYGQQTLTVKFLPGVPEKFHKSFEIQVAHFEPDTVNLFGEGVFPRVSLDLPRAGDEEGHYDSLVKDAKETLSSETKMRKERPTSAVSATVQRESHREDDNTSDHHDSQPSDLEIQMEIERLLVKEFAIEMDSVNNLPDILEVNSTSRQTTTVRESRDNTVRDSRDSKRSRSRRKPKPRPRLPDYLLDFGHVVLGTVRTHVVRATNTGWFPVSFSVDREFLYQFGFNVELDRVRQLPGAPDHETVDFVVSFDPRGANLGLGDVDTIVPINIVGGPQVCIRLKANVTMPDMQISTDVLEFSEVRCGECKVITVQLHNHKHVRCDWNSLPTEKDKRKEARELAKADKHVPMHLRRKMKQEKSRARTFEMMPPTGSLMPGQRLNVQVKFMPTEEKFYEIRIPIRLSQSSQRIMLLCRGQGQEPRVEFDRNLVEFGPILPHSSGDEQDIIISNPCSFPIELYSLEFDKVYLEEEKILRLMKGYDEHNTILLPPRPSGEKLPQELLEYYEEQMKKLEEAERARREAEEAAEAARREQEEREAAERAERGEDVDLEGKDTDTQPDGTAVLPEPPPKSNLLDVEAARAEDEEKKDKDETDGDEKLKDSASSVGVGELEITPVSAAIARHLGIDLSPEGKASRNRRGIAIIVHGAPLSGKTSTAVMLAKQYEAALLTIDGVVMEAISNGSTAPGLRARELCAEAARKRMEELKAMEGEMDPEKKAAGGLSVEALTAHTQGAGVPAVAATHSVAHSMVSNRKTSTISDQKSKDKHHGSTVGGKTAVMTSSGEGTSQVPSSPPPLAAPIARRLSVSASVAGEEGLLSCVLPEDLLVDILAERLMLNDCHRGIVFDGLETLFAQNMFTAAHAILKAFNNRRYIYFVTLKLDYNIMKEREKKDQEEKERLAKEKEDQERQQLEEMSEDEYDALSDEQKAEIDRKRLEIKKERLRREMEEKREKERLAREAAEEEERRREEERMSKKKKKDGKDGKKSQAAGKISDQKSSDRVAQKSQGGTKPTHDSTHGGVGKTASAMDRPESHLTEKSESNVEADGSKKKAEKGGKGGKRPISNEVPPPPEEPVRDPIKEAELFLMQRFRTFEHAQKEIVDLVDHWDRTVGICRPLTPSEGAGEGEDSSHMHPPSGRKPKRAGKHDLEKEKAEKERLKQLEQQKAAAAAAAAAAEKPKEGEGEDSPDGSTAQDQADTEQQQKRLEDGIGVQHIIINCADQDKVPGPKVMDSGKLPSVEEVLDGLGLGPRGPPIPPPASFAVVPYPVKRHAPPGAEGGHYIFVASSPDDPNIAVEEKPPELEPDEEKSTTPDGRKDDKDTPVKGKRGDKQKDKPGTDSKEGRRKPSAKSRLGRRSSMQTVSPPPGATTPASDNDGLSTAGDTAITEPKNPKLGIFRWNIPAQGEVVLRLRFQSEDLGQFDQTLNFEIMGTRRRYQLYCRGICAFPTISREPRIVFPHRKKNKKLDEIIQKKYVLTTETFEFGPLLVGKSRDKNPEGKYPENMEKFTISNTSPLEADISFCFLNDSKQETYIREPHNMLLKPGESQELTVWAYPKVPGTYEDSLVCCVRENPEPIIFKLLCYGVRPELELDKKALHFEKVLLHRKDTKTLYLRNSTLLPVAWKLSGLENLGDDFSVSQETGVIEPKSEFALHAHFRAMKPVTTNRKMIRLEVSDVDNIMGLVQTESVTVHAEAYDVALDMSFPKGADGGIDFETIRVGEDSKQQITLKNKGRYEISYAFTFEPTEGCPKEICDLFLVQPARGTLSPVDRPSQVQVQFNSSKEVTVKEQPILKCQVIEPNIVEGGETIASIPIKLSVRSVFSKYNIFPVNDINFGSMLVNSKKTRSFTIENKGDRFEFKYAITKLMREREQQPQRSRPPVRGSDKRARSRDGSSSGRSVSRPARRADSISDIDQSMVPKQDNRRRFARQDVGGGSNQTRLVLGMFAVYPAFGFILPGGHQTITVDCSAETAGKCDEEIAMEIAGRDPADCPGGIPYKLSSEACNPAINLTDFGSIFEEHRICKNLSVWQHSHQFESGGVFGEDENKFLFNNVLVGMKAKARFKIVNISKVPCDVLLSVKPIITRHSPKHTDVFDVEPTKAQISSHSHIYATVTFTPPSMQAFNATFEAAIDGVPQNQAKGRTGNLTFEVSGEGNLPRISIVRPSVRNKKGQPLMLFKKILIGRTQTMPLLVTNDGTLPSKVDIDLFDPDGSFMIKPAGSTKAIMSNHSDEFEPRKMPHTASVIAGIGESASFDVTFKPSQSQRSQAQIRLIVVNNQYEDSVIQLVGEGYQDDITLDNIHSVIMPLDPEQQEGNMAEDDVQAAKSNHIQFGDCYINEARTLTFTMTNHSKTDCVRFQWPDHVQLKFSPQVGHLHPASSKDMTVTFKTDAPKNLDEEEIPCKISKITFEKPVSEVADWDDRQRTVKWIDMAPTPTTTADSAAKGTTPVPQATTPTPVSRPAKKKIIETEPEPSFTEVPESSRTAELLVSANADYCKYKCKVEGIKFRDTLMFQTRVYEFQLSNKSNVAMDYTWQVLMEEYSSGPRSVTFAGDEDSRPATAAAHAMRPGSAMRPSSAESSVLSDASYVPFTVCPDHATLMPGKKANIVVKFSPLDVQDYEARIICTIPNLESGKRGPVIGLRARSLMPYCHFELEDSDYITSARRNPELRGPGGAPPGLTLDPNTKVIEFNTVGVGVRNVRKFSIVNPTSQIYSYQWINEDEPDPKRLPDFKCLTPKGNVRSGKKAEIAFEFTSSQLDVVESFWTFIIPEQNISIPFLVVGNTRDPNITMDRSHLNFKSLLIGHEAVEVVNILNSEDSEFYFSFVESSCHSAGYSSHLIVEPMTGYVPANGVVPINIYFTPNSDKEINFNLVCNIKKKTLPLTLNVKAEGYSMDCIVLCEDSTGQKVELSPKGLNEINFGEVEVNERSIRNIYIVNSGKFNFDYTWSLNERSLRKENMVSVTPETGGVMFDQRQRCQLAFCPPCKTTLRGCELLLKISNGPRYLINVGGHGVPPGLHFSWQTYNFGPCFIHKAGMPLHTCQLSITNKDTKEISVDCLYQPTQCLQHDFEAQVIPVGHTVPVTFTFYTREAIKYQEVVTFEINGLSRQSVEILGQGTEMKVEVTDAKQKIVKFGALRVGQTSKKVVPIINRSPAPITFHLAVTPSNFALQDVNVLKLLPTQEITLAPNGGTTKVEMIFSPKTRVTQFAEEVLLECAGLSQPLFVVTGSCQAIEISLDAESMPFGAVVQKSSTMRKLVMTNTGDIGARFKWDLKKFGPDFSILPVDGYISPGMEVPFEVTFHPPTINKDIRYDNLKCNIEGSRPLKLTLTGMCVELPPVRDIMHFNTHVRQKETRNLQVSNRTNLHWNLRPAVSGEFWSGPDTLSVEPMSTKPYELSYKPLVMTTDGRKHMGTVFFPLPDGTGLMYNVSGTADPPKANGKVTRDVPCKTSYTEMLTVNNWLKKPQRFRVKIEMIRPDKLDPGTTIKHLDYIDVPGNSKRDYKLTFYAHREGASQLKVVFVNEQTNEYQFYEVTFKAVRPGVIALIDLTTPVRQSVPYTIKLENPLSYAITFAASCTIPEILMPNGLTVPAQSEGAFSIEYQPLKVGQQQGRLEFNCNDLGLYMYDLELKATPAGPEKGLYFRTCLGTSQVQVAKFQNFSKQKTDYQCKVDNSDFHVDNKTVAAAPGSSAGMEVAVEVTYEPSRIGESRGKLMLSSGIGGDYVFPLSGTCIQPKPQGPYTVRAGSTTSITFRNVFAHTTPFTFQVDNPLFHVAKPGENIRARKDHRVVVGFDKNDTGSKAAVMGKLVVSCAKSAGGTSNAQWVYYLKGIPNA